MFLFTEGLIVLPLATMLLVKLPVNLSFNIFPFGSWVLSTLRFGVTGDRFEDLLMRLEGRGVLGLLTGVEIESLQTLGLIRPLGFDTGSRIGETKTRLGCGCLPHSSG